MTHPTLFDLDQPAPTNDDWLTRFEALTPADLDHMPHPCPWCHLHGDTDCTHPGIHPSRYLGEFTWIRKVHASPRYVKRRNGTPCRCHYCVGVPLITR